MTAVSKSVFMLRHVQRSEGVRVFRCFTGETPVGGTVEGVFARMERTEAWGFHGY